MSEPTLDDLRVPCEHGRYEEHPPPLSVEGMTERAMCPGGRPAEFDRIATENGYVKRPACEACEGSGRRPDSPIWDGPAPCPSCGGSGFGRLVTIPHDAVTLPGHYWIDGERVEDPSAAFVLVPLAAIDQEDTHG